MTPETISNNLYYLTEQLRNRSGYLQTVTNKLNEDGKRTKMGKVYTRDIVNNAVRGLIDDDNVTLYLEDLVRKYLLQLAEDKKTKTVVRKRLRSAAAVLRSV